MIERGAARRAVEEFRRHGGILRTAEAIRAGIHPRTLYALNDKGTIERLSRGMFRLAELPELGEPDLAVVAKRIPRGVVCLISALAIHELTTQVPHAVDVALMRGSERPRLRHPPIDIHWFSGKAFTEGVDERYMDGVVLRVYGPEKTLADCFKARNRIGLDVCLCCDSGQAQEAGSLKSRGPSGNVVLEAVPHGGGHHGQGSSQESRGAGGPHPNGPLGAVHCPDAA